MGPSFVRVDIVNVALDIFAEGIIVQHRYLNRNHSFVILNKNRLFNELFFSAVKVLDELAQTSIAVKGLDESIAILVLLTLVFKYDPNPLVKKAELPHPVG